MTSRIKIVLSMMVILIAIIATVGGTFAWFTDESEAIENVFTAGTVIISANETGKYAEGEDNWNPGDDGDKNIQVVVEGSKNIYLRADLSEHWENLNEDLWDGEDNDRSINWDNTVDYDGGWYLIDRGNWGNNLPNKVEWYIDGDMDSGTPWPGDEWQYLDGYWYYIGAVAENDDGILKENDSVYFLSHVKLKGLETTNEYQGAVYEINVVFDAIQASNEAINDAWGVRWNSETGEFVQIQP